MRQQGKLLRHGLTCGVWTAQLWRVELRLQEGIVATSYTAAALLRTSQQAQDAASG